MNGVWAMPGKPITVTGEHVKKLLRRLDMADVANELFGLSEELVVLKEAKKELDSIVKENNRKIEQVEEKMVALMLEDEVQSFKRDGKTFFISTRLFASIPEENKEDVLDWFKSDPVLSGMVKEQINANSLSAWVKEQDEDLPEEIRERLKIYEKTSIGVRSGK
jgi:hypothetical protein